MARGPSAAAGEPADLGRADFFPGLPRSFGRTLREHRERRRIGLRSLAHTCGLSPSYLSRIERDLVPPPSPKFIDHLARALGADPEALLAAAGIIPEHVLALLRERPAPTALLLGFLGGMTDDEVLRVCDELRRRLQDRRPSLPRAGV